jgi:hypothetical protein
MFVNQERDEQIWDNHEFVEKSFGFPSKTSESTKTNGPNQAQDIWIQVAGSVTKPEGRRTERKDGGNLVADKAGIDPKLLDDGYPEDENAAIPSQNVEMGNSAEEDKREGKKKGCIIM